MRSVDLFPRRLSWKRLRDGQSATRPLARGCVVAHEQGPRRGECEFSRIRNHLGGRAFNQSISAADNIVPRVVVARMRSAKGSVRRAPWLLAGLAMAAVLALMVYGIAPHQLAQSDRNVPGATTGPGKSSLSD